jgi:hypothetical protein
VEILSADVKTQAEDKVPDLTHTCVSPEGYHLSMSLHLEFAMFLLGVEVDANDLSHLTE